MRLVYRNNREEPTFDQKQKNRIQQKAIDRITGGVAQLVEQRPQKPPRDKRPLVIVNGYKEFLLSRWFAWGGGEVL